MPRVFEENGGVEETQEEKELRDKAMRTVKVCLTPICLSVVVACLWVYGRYLQDSGSMVPPSDLDISTLLLFALGILALVWVPWEALGLRIKKIGGIEVEQIVANQASEHAEEIGHLLHRIMELESRHQIQPMGLTPPEASADTGTLRALLLRFLDEHSKWAFSPLRILKWGAMQEGFEELAGFELREIRDELLKMVSDQVLVTRISKFGNTLYRVPVARDMQ